MAERLLEVDDLKVQFATEDGVVRAVDGVSFTLERGKVLGIVGESGSGKSVTAMTLLGLTRGMNAQLRGRGRATRARTCSTMSEAKLQQIRGNEMAMIFQDPMTSMNPVYRVGDADRRGDPDARGHRQASGAKRRAVELLQQVGIPNPERRVDDYPHQFSGGMRQRAMIAMALANNPDVLIADEPTTALDVTIQAQIIELIDRLKDDFNSAVILITHDLGVVADIADEIVVMYAGRVVEHGGEAPALLRPAASVHVGAARLDPAARPAEAPSGSHSIEGAPPSLINLAARAASSGRAARTRSRSATRSRRSRTASRTRATSTAAG